MPNRALLNKTVFDNAKNLNHPRSKFKRPSSLATTFNAGDIIPIYVDEVLAGDSWKIDVDKFIRLSTPINPTMDDLYLETFWFFCPNRILWDHWEQFCGASDKAWVDTTQYTVPTIELFNKGTSAVKRTSLANYMLSNPNIVMSVNTGVEVNALPFRAYGLIYNYFFRDENLEDVIPVYTGDSIVVSGNDDIFGHDYFFVNGSTHYFVDIDNSCLKASAYHDYFTSALPQPQKGDDVLIPAGGWVSLQQQPGDFVLSGANVFPSFGNLTRGSNFTFSPLTNTSRAIYAQGISASSTTVESYIQGVGGGQISNILYDPAGTLGFDNLQITVNNLRLAIIAQQWQELNGRSGSRYQEYLWAHFKTDAGDARLQQPEYLGGSMTLLNMSQVTQTSETDATPLGTLAGNSVTYSTKHEVFKSFVEHGIIMCLAVVRNKRTYSQGIDAMWFRETIFDYYDPLFANIGEQPIYNREIYVSGNQATDKAVFGYKEAWSEYKYKPDKVSGLFSPSVISNLASWNYSSNYVTTPVLSKEWLRQGVTEIDRTLQVTSANAPQFMAQFAFKTETTRVMPRYNIPGLHRI